MKAWLIALALVVAAVAAAVGAPVLLVVLLLAGRASGAAGASAPPPAALAGIDPVLLDAYVRAVGNVPAVAPRCAGLRWSILAGIGQVESGQAQGRRISPTGDVTPPVIGPALDGSGVGGNRTAIVDSDAGRWDGDTVYDRAVGVLQFLPGTWLAMGQDGNGDGVRNPHNVYDVTLAAVVHLCGTAARDLADPAQLREALFGYNHSQAYVAQVLAWITTFDQLAAAEPGPVAGAGGRGDVIVAAAMRWLGTPYAWGGGGPAGPTRGICCSPGGYDARGLVGFDCSGLTTYAYTQVGISLPRVSSQQYRTGQRIPRSAGLAALQPGDLVFFAFDPVSGAGVHHVGIYVGGGQMVNAPRSGTVVRVEPVWMDSYAGAVRWAE